METKVIKKEVKKNGVDSKNPIPAQEVKPTAQPQNPADSESKEKVFRIIDKFKPEAPKTPEERIELAKQFTELTNRYKHLKEKSNDLAMFEAGNDKMQAKVTFENAQGFKFVIQNSNVIDVLKKSAKEELLILLQEADNEIMTFVM